MRPATTLNGVASLRAYSPGESPSRSFYRTQERRSTRPATVSFMARLLLRFTGGALPAPRERVEPHQERWPERQHERNRRQERPGQLGIRRGPEVHPEAELLERDVGQVEPAGAAHLVLAVDVVDVAVRVLVDAGLRALQELSPLAELEGSAGAHLGARRELALPQAVGAEGALPDERERPVVLELRDPEGARDHAVAAPDAAVRAVHDRPLGELVERVDEARGHARRGHAVHALGLREGRGAAVARLPPAVHHRVGARVGGPRRLEDGVVPELRRGGGPVRLASRPLPPPAAHPAGGG